MRSNPFRQYFITTWDGSHQDLGFKYYFKSFKYVERLLEPAWRASWGFHFHNYSTSIVPGKLNQAQMEYLI